MDIYREFIMENYRNPKNFGKLENFSIKNKSSNKSCGDSLEIYLKIKDNKIEDVKYEAQGCAMSVSSMSIFSTKIKGKDIDDLLSLEIEDYFDMINIHPTFSRVKCVELGLNTLKEAISKYKSEC